MATTLSSSPGESSRRASAIALTDTFQPRARTGRLKLWMVVVVVTVSLAGGLAWAAVRWSRAAQQLANIDVFTVVPRTFMVSLEEKGELKASNSTDIICEVEGRSTIIYLIPEGTAVKEGDLLVELASDQIEDRIRQDELKETNSITAYEAAQTELEIQRDKNASDIRKADLKIELNGLALEKYEKGDWQQALKDAQIDIQQATINLKRRTEDFQADKELRAKNFITKTEYDESYFDFKRSEWELEKANKALEVLETYTHVADSRQRESDLEEAIKERERIVKNADAEELKKVRSLEGKKKELDLIQDQLAKLRTQKEKCRIYAPTQGFVVYYAGRGGRRFFMSGDQIKEGATVHERQVLLSLPDTSEMMATVRVHEAKTDKLHIGQPVVVKVEGMPGQQFAGKVSKIAVLADSQNRWLNPDLKEYETEITLDPTDAPLKPGVTAYCQILVENVDDKLAVPVQTVYAKSGRRYVFREAAREVKPVAVTIGAVGTEWAEITDGLTGGEQILLTFTDQHKRLIPDAPPSPPRPYRAGMSQRGQGRPAADAMRAKSPSDKPDTPRPSSPHSRGASGYSHARTRTPPKSTSTP